MTKTGVNQVGALPTTGNGRMLIFFNLAAHVQTIFGDILQSTLHRRLKNPRRSSRSCGSLNALVELLGRMASGLGDFT